MLFPDVHKTQAPQSPNQTDSNRSMSTKIELQDISLHLLLSNNQYFRKGNLTVHDSSTIFIQIKFFFRLEESLLHHSDVSLCQNILMIYQYILFGRKILLIIILQSTICYMLWHCVILISVYIFDWLLIRKILKY